MTIAYWCVFVCIFLPIFCAMYAKKNAHFTFEDNANPRAFMKRLKGKAARADAAQKNGYEIFPPFASAVIIAQATGGASQLTIDIWALLFVLGRFVFIWAYIGDKPLLRSLVFNANTVCIVALFVAAV